MGSGSGSGSMVGTASCMTIELASTGMLSEEEAALPELEAPGAQAVRARVRAVSRAPSRKSL